MDEMLSFELANAEFTPWIVTTQPVGRLEKFVQNEIYGDTVSETWGNFFDTVKDEDVIDELLQVDIANLTPLDAINTLYKLQNMIKNRW